MILLYIGSFPYTWGGSMNKPYAYYEHKKLKSFKELLEFNGKYASMWRDYQTSIQWKVGKEAD